MNPINDSLPPAYVPFAVMPDPTTISQAASPFKVLVGILAASAIYLVYAVYQHAQLRALRGPTAAGWSKFWLLKCVQSGSRMHHIFHDISKKYGKFARIGPTTLLVADVESLRKANAPKSKYHRSQDRALEDDCWYPSKGILRPLDWGYLASYFSIDSITDISFSQPLGDLKEDKDKWNFLHNTEDNLKPMSFFTIFPEILNLNPLWLMVKFLAPHPDDNSPFGMVMGFARRCARERYGEKKVEKNDMLGVFVRQGMSQYEAERTGLLQLVAGSDTVATSLRAAILYIASDPAIVRRIRAELAEAGISPDRPTSEIVNYAEARNIRYILAVLREVLRIHPPAIATMEEQLGNESDVLPDGRVILAKTIIALSLTSILRDPETFGPDAELFRPERWLEDVDEETKKKMDRAHELIFGSGRFLCLGREIAMMHIVKVVIEIFNRYDISVMNPEKPWHSLAFGIFVQHDQWVKVTKRDLSGEDFVPWASEKTNGATVH
ncbi:Isotrichodermin C-15 hydroxylase [Elsinoe australis]|uniref:Isotrichodermin C-15 hydroxylase n=1 Tax=Elsinoe australis TaxID=40998 RepID=A0A2P7Z1D0_9PEZI|nr:Isotrichodermin C-15 hydroxylase [Elsinoe australis]